MKTLLSIATLAVVCCGMSAGGQVLTSGQILPTNAVTYIPATNGTQSTISPTFQVPQTTAAIANQNLSLTNQLNQAAYLTINGIQVCQLIQKWAGPSGTTTAATIGLIYNPTATNNTTTPDIVYTLPTNLTFGITYAPAVTNNGSTNVQYTINRTQ
jgi:hypothetical protein